MPHDHPLFRAPFSIALALWLVAAPRPCAAVVLDFESLAPGGRVDGSALPQGFTLTVTNGRGGHPNAAIVFDSACTSGCTGGDSDLRTPGSGAGNDAAQGHVMIIAENLVDSSPADGIVDDPDDEGRGGTITLTFPEPLPVAGLRAIDIDASETTGRLELALAAGGTVSRTLLPLGDDSAQAVVFDGTPVATAMTIVLPGSGAIDDITLEVAECGDGVRQVGEQCDRADAGTCPGQCGDDCKCPAPPTTTVPSPTTSSLPAGASTTSTQSTTTSSVPIETSTTTFTTTTTTLPALPNKCDVTLALTDAVTIGALQLDVDYSQADGGFAGTGAAVQCESLAGDGLGAFHDDDFGERLTAGLASVAGIAGPVSLARCTFDAGPVDPVAQDFTIAVTEAKDPDSNPVTANVSIADITCAGCGDANGDGAVTATDARRALVASVNALYACSGAACDVNASGRVDSVDALATLRMAIGITDDSICSRPTVVVFRVPEAVLLGGIQFDVDYSAESGGFSGAGEDVECRTLIDLGAPNEGLAAFGNDVDARLLSVAIVSLAGIQTPVDLAACIFDRVGPLAPLSLNVTTIDARTPAEEPVAGMSVVAEER